ncbi:MAG: hypothetical protein B7C24_00560 [Bacteroidetes bacterium 4572_77]|nr:MAG: hypothetical protein B7C24_00560 [Bacteroidetes bacterium 4572_77]
MGKKQILSAQEIIDFGLRHMYGRLIKEGFEVLNVRPEPEIDPQILAKKDQELYFIIVRTDVYPAVGDMPSISRISQIKSHAKKHQAKTKFASIGLQNAQAKNEADKSILIKGGEFYVNYSGLHELVRFTGDER